MSRKHKETAEVSQVNQEKKVVPAPAQVSVGESLKELKELLDKAFYGIGEEKRERERLLEIINRLLLSQVDQLKKQHETDQLIINILLNTLEYEPKLTRLKKWLKK